MGTLRKNRTVLARLPLSLALVSLVTSIIHAPDDGLAVSAVVVGAALQRVQLCVARDRVFCSYGRGERASTHDYNCNCEFGEHSISGNAVRVFDGSKMRKRC